MNAYPFVYLNHGKISINSVGKNEEIFIWFKRKVTRTEQKLIMENIPQPLSCALCWGNEFLYFGSGGDTYDFEVIETYAKEEAKLLAGISDGNFDESEFGDFDQIIQTALEKAVPIFSEAIENWVMQVNEIVPIVFFYAPNNPDEDGDEWATWSKKNIYSIASPYLLNYKQRYPKVFEKPTEEERFYGYILKFLLNYIHKDNGNIEETLLQIELGFDMDNIHKAFDRLYSEDSTLQGNANNLYNVLESFTPKERVAQISNLKPYTQFAYYASYAATRKKDLLVHKEPLIFIKKLLENLPSNRKKVVGTYLRFIAENLVKTGPGFDKKDKTHAALAAEVMEHSLKYETTEETFVNGAAFYDWQKNYESMLNISLQGIKKFPNQNTIIANILYSAEKCGKPELAEKYVNQKSEDPLILANQSFSLVTSGKNKEAYELLINHFNKNGTFNEYSLNNLLYLCTEYKKPAPKILDAIIELAINNIYKDFNYRNLPDFLNTLIRLLNNLESDHQLVNYHRVVDLFTAYKKLGGNPNCSAYGGFTYAIIMCRSKELIKKEIDEIVKNHDANAAAFKMETGSYFILTGNLAGMFALINDKPNMLKFLKITKAVHSNFNSLKQDYDFSDYLNDTDFLAMFK